MYLYVSDIIIVVVVCLFVFILYYALITHRVSHYFWL